MDLHFTASYALWLSTLAIQIGIGLMMLTKRLYRDLPIFLGYTVFQVLRSIALLVIRTKGSPASYSYAYWIAEAISGAVGFIVIYEVFSEVLDPYKGLKRLGVMLFQWAFIVLVLLAIATSLSPTTEKSPGFIVAVLAFERSVRIIQCGLMVFLFLFASTLSLSWRHYSFGIAIGFGLFATVELILAAVRMQVGPAANSTYVLLKPGAYVLSTLLWGIYLISPVPQPRPVNSSLSTYVDHWNETVLAFLTR